MIYPDDLVFSSRTLGGSTKLIGTFSLPAGTLNKAPSAAITSFTLTGDEFDGGLSINPAHTPVAAVYPGQPEHAPLSHFITEQIWSETCKSCYTADKPGGSMVLISLPLLPNENPDSIQRFLFLATFKNHHHKISHSKFSLFKGTQENVSSNLVFSFSQCMDIAPSTLIELSDYAFFSALKSLTLKNKGGCLYSLSYDSPQHVRDIEHLAIEQLLDSKRISESTLDKLTQYQLGLFYSDANQCYLTRELAKVTPLLLISKKRLLTLDESLQLNEKKKDLKSRFLAMGYCPEKRLP